MNSVDSSHLPSFDFSGREFTVDDACLLDPAISLEPDATSTSTSKGNRRCRKEQAAPYVKEGWKRYQGRLHRAEPGERDFAKNRKELLDRLICPVCHNLFNNPVAMCEAEHKFCLKCMESWIAVEKKDICPVCKRNLSDFSVTSVDEGINDIVKGLLVKCCNDGCNESVKIAEIGRHINECQHEMLKCPGGCDEPRMKRIDLEEHIKSCPNHFSCRGEQMPTNKSRENLQNYIKHVTGNPAQHPGEFFLLSSVKAYGAVPERIRVQDAYYESTHWERELYCSIDDPNTYIFPFTFEGWDEDALGGYSIALKGRSSAIPDGLYYDKNVSFGFLPDKTSKKVFVRYYYGDCLRLECGLYGNSPVRMRINQSLWHKQKCYIAAGEAKLLNVVG